MLFSLFRAAVEAADPMRIVPPHLPARPRGRALVIGAGKASAQMARAVELNWPGPLEGLVVTRYGYKVPTDRIEIVEAAHPVPDRAGLDAAARILQLVRGLSADDLVLCLISGGGSSLLPLPANGLTLADKQLVNRALLRSGATISEINSVRKHLSAIKGGRLAAACAPARVVTLLISDVPGDDPSVIASGPTVPDPTTSADALAILQKYAISEPAAALDHLRRGHDETPKPGDPRLAAAEAILVGAPQASLEAAAAVARAAGVTPLILSDAIEGEARDVALVHAPLRARSPPTDSRRARRACCCPGAKRRSPCAARGVAGATPNSCWPWRSRWTGTRRCTPSRAIPTESMAPRTTPARSPVPIRSPARRRWDCAPRTSWPITTATRSSNASVIWWSPGPL